MPISVSNLRYRSSRALPQTGPGDNLTVALDIDFGRRPVRRQDVLVNWIITNLLTGEVFNSHSRHENVDRYGQYIWVSSSRPAYRFGLRRPNMDAGVYELKAIVRPVSGSERNGLSEINHRLPLITESIVFNTDDRSTQYNERFAN